MIGRPPGRLAAGLLAACLVGPPPGVRGPLRGLAARAPAPAPLLIVVSSFLLSLQGASSSV